MPELPDVTVYVEALRERVVAHRLNRVQIRGPFLLRSATPPLESVFGKTAREVRRVGKRIAFGFEDELWLVLHLMIAGRLHWRAAGSKTNSRSMLAHFEFDSGVLQLTEAGSQHRAALHVVAGDDGLRALDPGGIEPLEASLAAFTASLRSTCAAAVRPSNG